MKRRLARISAALVVSAVIVPALASAPPGQYDAFNRQSGVIRDTQTKLTWQRFVDGLRYSRSDAVAFCQGYNSPDMVTRKWRLPTVKELLTLVDEQPHQEYPLGSSDAVTLYIDGRAFPDTPTGEYWTSSVSPGPRYYVVSFGNGESRREPDPGSPFFVRCVSDSP